MIKTPLGEVYFNISFSGKEHPIDQDTLIEDSFSVELKHKAVKTDLPQNNNVEQTILIEIKVKKLKNIQSPLDFTIQAGLMPVTDKIVTHIDTGEDLFSLEFETKDYRLHLANRAFEPEKNLEFTEINNEIKHKKFLTTLNVDDYKQRNFSFFRNVAALQELDNIVLYYAISWKNYEPTTDDIATYLAAEMAMPS